MVQRQELLERLLAAHEGYFDVEDTFELAGQTFQGRAQFHSESMQYVLSKKAKIWGANIHEHVLFRSLEHLDMTTLEELIAFMTVSYTHLHRRSQEITRTHFHIFFKGGFGRLFCCRFSFGYGFAAESSALAGDEKDLHRLEV